MRRIRLTRSIYANPKQLAKISSISERLASDIPTDGTSTEYVPEYNSKIHLKVLPRKESPQNDIVGMSFADDSKGNLGELRLRTETPNATMSEAVAKLKSDPITDPTIAHELTHMVDVHNKEIPLNPPKSDVPERYKSADEKKAYAYDSLISAKNYYNSIKVTPSQDQYAEKAKEFAKHGNPYSINLVERMSPDSYKEFF